jgi:septum formation protein
MIYLASRSPRRAELLTQIGVQYRVYAIDIDETRSATETPAEYVCRMAKEKASIVARELALQRGDFHVLAADTTITLDGDIIGKPTDREHCRCILEQLSARQHLVLSAVALATADDVTVRLVQNRVSFRALSPAEIASYMDKAGAYAIQGKAAVFIEYLEGSYSAVMGLPLYETAELLQGAGIELY